jgi:hypothetical protein
MIHHNEFGKSPVQVQSELRFAPCLWPGGLARTQLI